MQRWGQNKSWAPGVVQLRQRKGNLSMQLHKPQIKSCDCLGKSCVHGTYECTSVPTTDTSPNFAAVDFGRKYWHELGHVRVWAAPTVPTEDPQIYLEVFEGLLRRWGLAVAHCGNKETDRGGPRKIFLLLLFLFCFVLFSCWWYCFIIFHFFTLL